MPIYKNYDIRGLYPSEINELAVEKIGRAFVSYLKLAGKTVVAARDGRPHSPSLFNALTKGIRSAGAHVIDIGLSTTPMFYYGVFSLGAHAGITVTASHNPAQYNGLKMVQEGARPFGGDDIQRIREMVESGNLPPPAGKDNSGSITTSDVLHPYLSTLLKLSPVTKPLSVVVDFGNGMGSHTIIPLFAKTKLKTTYLYEKIDMSFPHHEANPLKKETLADLQKAVRTGKADLGIAFDGDADRVGFVDEKGDPILMDHVTALLAADTLKKHPGAGIVYDIRSSWIVEETIRANGGTPLPSRVGHTNIKALMHDTKAIFAGEVSGHYYYEEMNKTDNGELTALKVLAIIAESGKKLSELMKPYQKYAKSDELNFDVGTNATTIMELLKKNYANGALNTLDGIRIDYPDWWFNVRPSNTEPLLRLIVEAKTPTLLKEKVEELTTLIKKAVPHT